MKQKILEQIGIFLLMKRFTVKTLTRTCFDIVARKGSSILLIKVLEDANAITPVFSEEMKNVSSYISAAPIIISEKAGSKLQNNVIYSRCGIYTLNLPTFKSSIEKKLPFVYKSNAGLTANIIGDKLKQLREKHNLSLNELSNNIGVSRSMVQKYEEGVSNISVNKAIKMYDLFGDSIFNKINILDHHEEIISNPKGDICGKYDGLGFMVSKTKKVPFDLISKKDDEIILTEIGDKTPKQLKSLSHLIDANNLVIFKRKKPKNTASLTKEEFMEYGEADELIKFLKEFE